MMKYRVKHITEYLALRIMAGLVNLLPYHAALFLGWLNAWASFFVFRFRVNEARSRIRQVFGNRFSRRQINRIAWQSWRNIVFSGIEMIRLKKMTLNWIMSIFDCDSFISTLKRHCDTGRGAVVACPHMGSWEMACVACHLYGIPIFNIAAQQKNPLANEYLNKLRRSPGIDTIARGSGTMREVMNKLKAGKVLAILPDVRMRVKGIRIPFLGKEANVGEGMALFARHTNVPIFPCIVTRRGWGRHKIDIYEPIWPDNNLDKKEDVRRMTTKVMDIIENAIRSDPAQWFWFNKRWILDPL